VAASGTACYKVRFDFDSNALRTPFDDLRYDRYDDRCGVLHCNLNKQAVGGPPPRYAPPLSSLCGWAPKRFAPPNRPPRLQTAMSQPTVNNFRRPPLQLPDV